MAVPQIIPKTAMAAIARSKFLNFITLSFQLINIWFDLQEFRFKCAESTSSGGSGINFRLWRISTSLHDFVKWSIALDQGVFLSRNTREKDSWLPVAKIRYCNRRGIAGWFNLGKISQGKTGFFSNFLQEIFYEGMVLFNPFSYFAVKNHIYHLIQPTTRDRRQLALFRIWIIFPETNWWEKPLTP